MTTNVDRRSSIGGRFALILLIAAGLAFGGAVAPAAGTTTGTTTATTGTIAGTVTGTGSPLAGVTVQVLGAYTGRVLQTGLTAADGTYRLTVVPTGLVKVRFAKTGWLASFAVGRTSFWSANAFALWPGRNLVLPRQDLVAEAVIEGQVLSWMDPLEGATVSVLDADTGRVLKSAYVPGYEYRIGGLAAGRVKVRATKAGYQPAYADGAHTFATARVFDLHAGEVLSQQWNPAMVLYLDLTPGGWINGDVLGLADDPSNGYDDPLPGVTVSVLDARTAQVLASTQTDAYGRYSVGMIEPYRPVKVRFTKSGWLTAYASGKASWCSADTYTVQPIGIVTLGTQAIYRKPAVEGQVLGDFDPLGYARVTVYDAVTGWRLGSTVADVGGYYRIDGLPARAVKVGATQDGWVPGFANGKSSLGTADVFVLQPGQTLRQQWDPMVLYIDLRRVLTT